MRIDKITAKKYLIGMTDCMKIHPLKEKYTAELSDIEVDDDNVIVGAIVTIKGRGYFQGMQMYSSEIVAKAVGKKRMTKWLKYGKDFIDKLLTIEAESEVGE